MQSTVLLQSLGVRVFITIIGLAMIYYSENDTIRSLSFQGCYAIQVPQPGSVQINVMTQINGINVNRVPLHRSVDDKDDLYTKPSPYCFSVCSLPHLLKKGTNFLATQVWPSARMVSCALERNLSLFNNNEISSICEFGCGPGLPSITAATILLDQQKKQQQQSSNGHRPIQVVATDLDLMALDLVTAAVKEQNLHHIVQTKQFDLTNTVLELIPPADLYIFSDVFESSNVAKGSAYITYQILNQYQQSYVWVFCQSDRSQRDIYLQELQFLLNDATLRWERPNEQLLAPIDTSFTDGRFRRLWLCEIDENNVKYN
jgi:Lysine methyltransferase